MPALRGSLTARRYRTTGELPKDVRGRVVRGLRSHAFLPIDPDSDLERSVGWVCLRDSEDVDFSADKVFSGERVMLGLRIDVLKPPAGEVRRELGRRERERGKAFSRGEKTALKAEIVRKLRKRSFVRTRVLDVVWTPAQGGSKRGAGRLHFFSRTKAANEALVELFSKSFGLAIDPEGPAAWATDAGADKKKPDPTPELLFGFAGRRRDG